MLSNERGSDGLYIDQVGVEENIEEEQLEEIPQWELSDELVAMFAKTEMKRMERKKQFQQEQRLDTSRYVIYT